MQIRKAKITDLDALVGLVDELMASHDGYDRPFYKQAPVGVRSGPIEKHLSEFIRGRKKKVLVAEVDGKVVGHISFEFKKRPPVYADTEMVYVDDFVVSKKHRGRGIGTALLEAALEVAKKRGVVWVKLNCDVGNESAMRIYEKSGFRKRQNVMVKKIG